MFKKLVCVVFCSLLAACSSKMNEDKSLDALFQNEFSEQSLADLENPNSESKSETTNTNKPVPVIKTIAEIKKLKKGSFVTVSGYLLRQINSDTYLLHDDTGEINVQIADNLWLLDPITDKQKILIAGQYEGLFNPEIKAIKLYLIEQ